MRLRQYAQTIRGKIILLFAITFVSVIGLTLVSLLSLYTIRNRLILSESYDDLLKNMLEVRRFEKNLLYFHDTQSLYEQVAYLDKIETLSDKLSEDITAHVSTKAALDHFHKNLSEYKQLVLNFRINGREGQKQGPQSEEEKIRALGKEMLLYVEGLLRTKRQRLHSAILRTSLPPFAFLAVFFLLMILVGRLVFTRLLQPLSGVAEITKRVARGDFTPISCGNMRKDEIHGLLRALDRMARELAANQEDLVQARKMAALGTFTAGIAHELNNPLNNISLTAQALGENCRDSLDPEAEEMLEDIVAQADRAGEIVKDLLDFSRMDQPSFRHLQVADVINETVNLVRNQLMISKVKLNLEIDENLPLINGSARNLVQALMNLILNATQAMENEGGAVTVEAHADLEGWVRIVAQDTGKGISKENLSHIFEPFYTTKSVGHGTGLGLAVTYSLIQRHRGRIEVQSEPGKGTRFTILIPAVRPESREQA